MEVIYKCPECGQTGSDNFEVSPPSFGSVGHQPSSPGRGGRRSEDNSTYHCKACGETSKGYEVKRRTE